MYQTYHSFHTRQRKTICLVLVCIVVVIFMIYWHPNTSFPREGIFSKPKINENKYHNVHKTWNRKSSYCGNQVLQQLDLVSIKRDTPLVYTPTTNLSIEHLKNRSCANLFLPWGKPPPKVFRSKSCFQRLLKVYSVEQKRKLADILRYLDQHFKAANIDLVMHGGTMLGSWRFHGLIPYDDDIDFVINKESKLKAHKLLSDLHKRDIHYRFRPNSLPFWKLDVGCKDQSKSWNCILQIDIFFFAIRPKEVFFYHDRKTIPRSSVFPLTRRPFLGVLLTAFNDYEGFHKVFFGKNMTLCKAINHSNSFRKSCGVPHFDCRYLRQFYPYVVRTQVEITPQMTEKSNSSPVGERLPIEFLIHNSTIVSIFTPGLLVSW